MSPNQHAQGTRAVVPRILGDSGVSQLVLIEMRSSSMVLPPYDLGVGCQRVGVIPASRDPDNGSAHQTGGQNAPPQSLVAPERDQKPAERSADRPAGDVYGLIAGHG